MLGVCDKELDCVCEGLPETLGVALELRVANWLDEPDKDAL